MQKWQRDMTTVIMGAQPRQLRNTQGQRGGINGNWRHNQKPPPNSTTNVAVKMGPCQCCGRDNHMKRICRHLHKICNTCGKQGHLSATCKVGPSPTSRLSPSTAKDAIAAKTKKTLTGASLGASESSQWLCPACLSFQPMSASGCTLKD